MSLTDFSDIQVFADATTYPIIPVLKKDASAGDLNYFKVAPEDLTALDNAKIEKQFSVSQSTLKDEYWTFESEIEQQLKEKLRKYPSVKEQFGKCYYGIKTGLNGAFIISSEQRQAIIENYPLEGEIIKPLFEGKDLKKWNAPEIDKWLIFSRRGIDIDKYPGVKAHLEQFREDLTPKTNKIQKQGRKPGKYEWYEIQDSVDYYPLFDSPKIIWPNLQSATKFAFDENGFYLTNPSVILPTDSKTLLCIMNSKLAWFFFQDICVIRSGGFVEMLIQYFEQLPVTLPEDETLFIEKADTVIEATVALQACQSDLLDLVMSELKPVKISKKLQNWIDLDWDGFQVELEKGKVKIKDLSLKERKEWRKEFSDEKKKTSGFQTTINQTENEIDQMVYQLYGLTDEEIKIVEGS